MAGDNGEFTRDEHQTLYAIVTTTSVIACIVLSFIVYMFLRFKDLRKVGPSMPTPPPATLDS